MVNQVRQGDVLLHPVAELPEGVRRVEADRLVLAEGEVTGHAHVVTAPGAALYELPEPGFTRYLVVDREGVRLIHEEHGAIAIAPGAYEVRRQREYAPGAIRNVAD